MSKIQDKQYIKVYNYSPIKICVETKTKRLVFEPASNDAPFMEYLNFEDIEYVNSKSAVFRKGELRFDPEEESEIFNVLGCTNWKDTILSEQDIDNIIFKHSPESIEKILNIKDISTIERIRGKVVFYVNEGRDISTNVVDIINRRFEEIRDGKIHSKIKTRNINTVKDKSDEVADLKAQLEQMKLMMDKLVSNTKLTDEVENDSNVKKSDNLENVKTPRRTQKKTK